MKPSLPAPQSAVAARERPWIMRTYSGHSSATASNELYRTNLAKGQTGLSVAFDLPTQTGYDSDHPMARGEVGKVGVPIDSIADMEALFRDIPLDRMNTSMTINATGAWLLALYVAAAERQGADAKNLQGTIQNDIIKEYLSRGTYVFPPEPSFRLTGDVIAYTVEHIPKWNPINICSYHLWVDEDGDDIGDGELTVEGRLVARGTKEAVIVFTSARENPGMKDWTYVQVSVNKEAVLEYCRFEYAFSGVQVHYSTGVIRNSLFRNNFEGIRFSTTDVRIENNDFLENYYGVRCEAHGSRTVIARNRFSGNEFAFFLVQKNWDSVKIYENNFEGSRGYDVKFGMNQKQDMDFTRNWWGTADAKEIEGKLYDRSKEEALGRVLFVPFLTERVAGCGIL